MKKSSKILLALLMVIVFLTVGVVAWQYDNITALINGLNNSTENLAVKIDDHRNKVQTEVKKYAPETIEDISAEDEQKLLKGEMNIDEIAEKYNLPIEYMKDEEVIIPEKKPDATKIPDDLQSDNIKKIEKEIGDSVARMYALKAKYVNKLGELEREVIKEYSNLPKSKQNSEGKKELVMSNINYVAKLEKTCDTEVDKVVSSLEQNLKELGGDLEIIQVLKKAYTDEKELKKSYYLSMYNE